jgi:tetratricopeptide (TPR) repeat protein
LIDQAHQAEIPSPAEVARAVQASGGTAAVPSRKPGQDREPAKAVPFLRKALALYKSLGRKDWSTDLERSTALEFGASWHQVEQIRRTAYEELLWLADDILARREDHVSGEQLSAPAAAQQALAYLEKAGVAYVPTTAFFSLRARCRGALGDKEAADDDSQWAWAIPPTLALDHDLLGQAALDAQNKDVAIKEFEEALRLEPTHYWSLMKLGQSFNDLGEGPADFAAAVAVFTGCIMKRPDFAPAYRYRAMAHWLLKQYEKCVQDYSKAIALDPKDARSWTNRGSAYNELHQYDKALGDFNKAIEQEPKDAGAWNNAAWLFATCPDARFRDAVKAVEFAKKAVELEPRVGGFWNTLGAAHYRAGEWKLAVEALKKSVDLCKGGECSDWFFLAMAHWMLGEKDKARQWYENAVQWMEKNNPQDDELRRFRAEAGELLGIENPGNPEPELVPPPRKAGHR